VTIRIFFIASAVFIFLSGVVSVLLPQMMFDAWGTPSNEAGLIITQLSGALEIGLGVILWLSRKEGASTIRRAIVLGGFITYSLFFIIMMINTSTELSAMAWGNIAVYLLLKPMGLNDDEAIADVVASGHYLVDLGQRLGLPIRICLEPTFVPEGTALHTALSEGRYTPPSLWAVVRATLALAELLPVDVGLSSEGLPTEAMPTACHRCSGMLRAALVRFNATQDKEGLVRLSCSCQAHEEQSR